MVKLKSTQSLYNTFVDQVNILNNKMEEKLNNIKEEHNKILSYEKRKLLNEICEGENLDFKKLKAKYLVSDYLSDSDNDESNDNLLSKIIINGNEYYYEPKENGNVYDKNSKIIGMFKNNKVILD